MKRRKEGSYSVGNQKTKRIFVADFETTVYEGQDHTEVWAAALVELYHDDVEVFHNISDFITALDMVEGNICVYFHNLKFDGEFIVDYFVRVLGFTVALEGDDVNGLHYTKNYKMCRKTIKAGISDMGLWYTVTVRTQHHIIEFRDSYKLLPFSVAKIGKGFDTKHKKLNMEYTGYRFAGCIITDREYEYISNDVLVVKEGLEALFAVGLNKLTIGACCMWEFKKHNLFCDTGLEIDCFFPDLYDKLIDTDYGTKTNGDQMTQGDYIRRAYHGGWCYVRPGKAKTVQRDGLTIDVNSLYPSMMHSISGNYYPYGVPHFFKGDLPEEARAEAHVYYFIRFRCRFQIKDGMLPFIQIKGNGLYIGKLSLETSDVYDPKTKYLLTDPVTLTMTCTDFELMQQHYNLTDLEILDGCWFHSEIGIFDEYLNKYMKIKQETRGARRQIAKLMQNSLYGKFSTNTNSSFKYPYVSDDGIIMYHRVPEFTKGPGYIPIGAAITSYSRRFTITAAQANFYGDDKPGFCYSDTDSCHIAGLTPNQLRGVKIHDKNYCCWKVESQWDEAYFTRQKTYIEHVTVEDGEPVTPYYNIKCAGMPDHCKDLFMLSMDGGADPEGHEKDGVFKPWSEEERRFLFDHGGRPIRRGYTDFDIGLQVPGKLVPVRMRGGIVLKDGYFTMRA